MHVGQEAVDPMSDEQIERALADIRRRNLEEALADRLPGVSVHGVWVRGGSPGTTLEVLVEYPKGTWRRVWSEDCLVDSYGVVSHIVEPIGIKDAPADEDSSCS